MSDETFLKINYRLGAGKKLDLENPVTFNEKLQWLKLYNRREEYIPWVDKASAKEKAAEVIGEEHIIPTLGVYDSFDDIDFDALPDSFVLKTTHDSGGVVVVPDKSRFDMKKARRRLSTSLKRNFYYAGREWVYKDVKPRIIAEQYMVDESGVELKDYKFFCFDGQVKMIQVDFNRFVKHKRNIFDTNWQVQDFMIKYPNDLSVKIEKPECLDEMLEIAGKLSQGIPHVRVDLYNISGKIYFGELTFYHGGGLEKFDPQEWNYTFGEWLRLPEKPYC